MKLKKDNRMWTELGAEGKVSEVWVAQLVTERHWRAWHTQAGAGSGTRQRLRFHWEKKKYGEAFQI